MAFVPFSFLFLLLLFFFLISSSDKFRGCERKSYLPRSKHFVILDGGIEKKVRETRSNQDKNVKMDGVT